MVYDRQYRLEISYWHALVAGPDLGAQGAQQSCRPARCAASTATRPPVISECQLHVRVPPPPRQITLLCRATGDCYLEYDRTTGRCADSAPRKVEYPTNPDLSWDPENVLQHCSFMHVLCTSCMPNEKPRMKCTIKAAGVRCRYESPGQAPGMASPQASLPAARATQLSFDPAPRGSGYEVSFNEAIWGNGQEVRL